MEILKSLGQNVDHCHGAGVETILSCLSFIHKLTFVKLILSRFLAFGNCIYVSCYHTCYAMVQVLLKGCYHIQQYSVPLLSVCSQLQNPGVVPLLRLTNFATQSPFWREMQRALVEGLVIF